MSDDSYIDTLVDSFISEAAKIEETISNLSQETKPLPIEEIVPLYHRIMNMNSLMQALSQIISDNDSDKKQRILERIKSTKALINDSFDTRLHPIILSQLNSSIQESTSALQSSKKKERSKQVIEEEARDYEKLRQQMSTKEFVEQYDKMIKND